jgi:hypothetical protein
VTPAPAGAHPFAGRAFGLAGAVALLGGPLAGCSRAVGVGGDVVPASGAAGGVATAASTEPPGSADPVGRLRGSLLGPEDLGSGWTADLPPLPDTSAPAPCGGQGTVARFPDALRVGSTVDGPPGFVVQEALSVYRDADTARAAFDAGAEGLGCPQGTLHGAAVTIAAAEDLRSDVGGDRASSWRVDSAALDAVLVVVQAREAVFTFAYVVPAGTQALARPDAVGLSRAAVARTLAA